MSSGWSKKGRAEEESRRPLLLAFIINNIAGRWRMLKEKIVIVDASKKNKLVCEVLLAKVGTLLREGEVGGRRHFRKGLPGTSNLMQAKNKQEGCLYALKEVLQDRRYKNRELSILARL